MCILETLPRAASVQAMEMSEFVVLPSTAFYQLYQARPEQYSILVLNIARDLSRRLGGWMKLTLRKFRGTLGIVSRNPLR